MPHTMGLNPELGVLAIRYSGDVSVEELMQVMDEAVHLAGFHAGLTAIGDFRNCEVSVTAADIDRLVGYAKRTDLAWGDTRWALIADKDYIYGLARIYMAKTQMMHVESRVFRSAEQADDWLGIGVSMDRALKETLERAA